MIKVIRNTHGPHLMYMDEVVSMTVEQFWQNRVNSLRDIHLSIENGEYAHFGEKGENQLKKSTDHDYKNAWLMLKKTRSNNSKR